MPGAMGFFEVFWHGEAIGDGSDLDEALAAYLAVQPEEGSWAAACADAQAQQYRSEFSAGARTFGDGCQVAD